jgi:hypothetical protein
MRFGNFTVAHYTSLIATLAFFSGGVAGLYYTKLSYDLNVSKDDRERNSNEPIVDIDIRPGRSASAADFTLTIVNRSEMQIAPQDITVLRDFDLGDFYLAGPGQGIELLKSTLSLRLMRIIPPNSTVALKSGVVAGVTDGKVDSFKTGVDLQFIVRIRLGDSLGTIRVIPIVRHVEK